MITIRPLEADDIEAIASVARQADIEEMRDGSGLTIDQALRVGLSESLRSWVVEHDGNLLAAAGDTMAGIGVGVPWMVTTVHVDRAQKAFLRASRAIVAEGMQRHQCMINYVDARNLVAIKWLAWLGFEVSEAVPYGPSGLPFHKFSMFRSN